MAKDLFNRYIWLIDTIYRAGHITFEQINDRWMRSGISDGEAIPLRTFHNHRKAIEQMFDINIECSKRGGYCYYIENAEEMENGGVRSWLLNTFTVSNIVNERHSLKKRILFEDIPSGQRFLVPIIEAMRDSLVVEIAYQAFYRDAPVTYEIEPYCVKVFNRRWYVVARNSRYNDVRIYALDRIASLRALDKKYVFPDDFDPQEFFYYSFGIIRDDDYDVERVRIKVSASHVKYLQALPLHHTQIQVEAAPAFSVMEYELRPTIDFRQELLSHGAELEVLSPKWLRDAMRDDLRAMLATYK